MLMGTCLAPRRVSDGTPTFSPYLHMFVERTYTELAAGEIRGTDRSRIRNEDVAKLQEKY